MIEKIETQTAEDARNALLHLVERGLLIKVRAFDNEYVMPASYARDLSSDRVEAKDLALARLPEDGVIWLIDDPVIELDNLIAGYNDTNRSVAQMLIGEKHG